MWLLKPRRRYNSSKKIEWIVEWLIKGFLVFWAYTFVRAIIILILGTMRHYGVIE
ncbi:hypothetical protein JCM10914_5581 [Paenibacillus sp. JCM 10914]|nr:hypothetical protein JCM10914_5581 [Paenibacillus sp. JCM 10914]